METLCHSNKPTSGTKLKHSSWPRSGSPSFSTKRLRLVHVVLSVELRWGNIHAFELALVFESCFVFNGKYDLVAGSSLLLFLDPILSLKRQIYFSIFSQDFLKF